ncbi:hypothetical protein HPP92_029072 [Vanilla planifolia]|uniref:Uncharacterized protein n=1 Tax=Vanilla planifolia TaxID=51239 RepID=A0A835U329_VANPL|nr:hypothetical protein HPP92_029061 [Vanilla planifolia]KAG0445978.1 hypothetical protein HPP92_029072 [Vanilla planifolia]
MKCTSACPASGTTSVSVPIVLPPSASIAPYHLNLPLNLPPRCGTGIVGPLSSVYISVKHSSPQADLAAFYHVSARTHAGHATKYLHWWWAGSSLLAPPSLVGAQRVEAEADDDLRSLVYTAAAQWASQPDVGRSGSPAPEKKDARRASMAFSRYRRVDVTPCILARRFETGEIPGGIRPIVKAASWKVGTDDAGREGSVRLSRARIRCRRTWGQGLYGVMHLSGKWGGWDRAKRMNGVLCAVEGVPGEDERGRPGSRGGGAVGEERCGSAGGGREEGIAAGERSGRELDSDHRVDGAGTFGGGGHINGSCEFLTSTLPQAVLVWLSYSLRS